MTDYIKTNEQLTSLCERATKRAFIILDTEFVRTRTLTPQLGLVQLNDGDSEYLIDPLCISDLSPLANLLVNPDCIKVLHACSEDLEAFQAALGVMPSPVFDTQFAAQLAGIGTTMGYANLIDTLLGIKLDKGESRTDWLARPLTDKQCEYAINDVKYLLPAYLAIVEKLSKSQIDIVYSESWLIAQKKKASLPDDFAYLVIKNNWRLNDKQRYVLKALASWRIQRAREKNMALNFVLREGVMVSVATSLPNSMTALNKVSGLTPKDARIVGRALLAIVTKALTEYESIEEQDRVPPIRRLSVQQAYKPTMGLLKQVVSEVAQASGIPEEILSSKKQLHQLLKYYWFDIDETRLQNLQPDLLCGWRKALFEDKLHAILA